MNEGGEKLIFHTSSNSNHHYLLTFVKLSDLAVEALSTTFDGKVV